MAERYQRTMFHTQEKRNQKLNFPVLCVDDDAWLGKGYYFWEDELDALKWGQNKKWRTGHFEIYKAEIDSENILDTVFNRKHYEMWVRVIEKAAKVITIRTNKKPTIAEINEYFTERGQWDEVEGILFQDIPKNDTLLVEKFFYRKRIQLVIFNKNAIVKFDFDRVERC